MDCFKLCRALRKKSSGNVFFSHSGLSLNKNSSRIKKAGFAEHFVKPVDAGALMDALAAHETDGKYDIRKSLLRE